MKRQSLDRFVLFEKRKKIWLIWILFEYSKHELSYRLEKSRPIADMYICVYFLRFMLWAVEICEASINIPMVTMTTSTRKAIKIDIHIYIETLRQIVNSQLKKPNAAIIVWNKWVL